MICVGIILVIVENGPIVMMMYSSGLYVLVIILMLYEFNYAFDNMKPHSKYRTKMFNIKMFKTQVNARR